MQIKSERKGGIARKVTLVPMRLNTIENIAAEVSPGLMRRERTEKIRRIGSNAVNRSRIGTDLWTLNDADGANRTLMTIERDHGEEVNQIQMEKGVGAVAGDKRAVARRRRMVGAEGTDGRRWDRSTLTGIRPSSPKCFSGPLIWLRKEEHILLTKDVEIKTIVAQ
jgi:hypothetical protein